MELLERHFDIALETPDGIKKLRELILSLAMKGKLVKQVKNEEPTSELLKEIEAKKQKLIREGLIKKKETFPLIKPEEIPYDLPKEWEWVRLSDIGEINPRNIFDDSKDAGFVPMPLIQAEYEKSHHYEIRKWRDIKKGFTHFADDDVALAKITPCFENRKSCVLKELPNGIGAGTTELHIFRNTFNAVLPDYVLAYFKNPRYILSGVSKMTGSAGQKRVPTEFFACNPFPLPPLAEQKRIVQKIDQLMALCDKLEAERNERDKSKIKIHSTAMNRLLSASDSTAFNSSWSFITKHFSELYSVTQNVDELKKAILQLAVMGKLVPQDVNDQPASELLKEIEAEKVRLVKDGKIKKQDAQSPINPVKLPFILPEGWVWCRFGDLVNVKSSKRIFERDYCNSGIPFYRSREIGELARNGFCVDRLYISETKYRNICNNFGVPKNGDILLTSVGSIGGCWVVDNRKFYYKDGNVTQIEINEHVYNFYIINFINSDLFTSQVIGSVSGTAYNALTIIKIKELLFPLPPLAEQKRIVKRLDQLMELCNSLEQQIKDSTEKKSEILEAVLSRV